MFIGSSRKPYFTRGLQSKIKYFRKIKNVAKRLKWSKYQHNWSLEQRNSVVFSDASSFTLFPITCQIYTWRQLKEVFDPNGLLPTVNGRRSVMTSFYILEIRWPNGFPLWQNKQSTPKHNVVLESIKSLSIHTTHASMENRC